MKVGIIKEGKIPPDYRVPLSPEQCVELENRLNGTVVVEPSPKRCFTDEEYENCGITLSTDLSECDTLLGVKEVPIDQLIPNKTYLFFSHTIKEQPYNRALLQNILRYNIRLIDYEVLTDENGMRLIAFGKFAGMVGAHNAIWTFSQKTGAFRLPRLHEMRDYAEAKSFYREMELPPVKIVVTGTGRVGMGAAQVLKDMNIEQVSTDAFLSTPDFGKAVFAQIDAPDYAKRKDGAPFSFPDYFTNPADYFSEFLPYTHQSDIMINGVYWDPQAPVFFTLEDMRSPDFRIRVISDITCDIAPESSIPSTLRATTIADPLFGFDPRTGKECALHQEDVVDVMSIDNLPAELPRDASEAFGRMFLDKVLDELIKGTESPVIQRATIAKDGELGEHFRHLKSYVERL
jgi:alanine dehydrogenase